MSKHKKSYEALFEQMKSAIERSPEELNLWISTSEKYAEAAKDMTKDEMSLIASYLKRDLKEFSRDYEESKKSFPSSPFYQLTANSIWQGLLDITDKTRIEMFEMFDDLEHQGVYRSGEVIGLGILVCEKCGHKEEYNHASTIQVCTECGGEEFNRLPLKP